MSFQRVRRLSVSKFLLLDDSGWKVPLLTPLCTKANNVKKPVRYTSIKKVKPKTIIDIARLLQQKTKDTKERRQSVISAAALKAATSTTKPATPNQLNDQRDTKATIVSNAKVQTSTSSLPAKVNVDGSSESQYVCESAPATALLDSAVDFAYSKCVDQMAMGGLHNKSYAEISIAKDAAPKAVDSGVQSPASNAPQEPSTQEDMTTNIRRVSELSSTNTKGLIPSSEEFLHKKPTPEVVVVSDEIVNMPEVMVTSKAIATPEVSSARDHLLEESFSDSEVVTVTNASTSVNITQAQYPSQPQSTQPQYFIASSWSSNVNADKTPSSQEIINLAVGSFPVACGEAPTRREVCHGEAVPVSDPIIPGVSLFKSTGDLPVVETISASLCKKSVKSGDAQSSINLNDPIPAHTDVLEEEVLKETFEELPEARLDPVKRLFIDKIREYSTKSQASGGLVDAGPEYEKVFNEELTKLQRLYGGGDLSKFPEFKFSESVLDESNSK
ncbi:hypothetical protein R3I93_005851 [Phoxinus phoxinus]